MRFAKLFFGYLHAQAVVSSWKVHIRYSDQCINIMLTRLSFFLALQKKIKVEKKNSNYYEFFFSFSSSNQDHATPLFIAAQNGHSAVLKLLLAAGAHPDTPRNDGATPLWIAAQMGHDHIVKLLLLHGAFVDAVRCVSIEGSCHGVL